MYVQRQPKSYEVENAWRGQGYLGTAKSKLEAILLHVLKSRAHNETCEVWTTLRQLAKDCGVCHADPRWDDPTTPRSWPDTTHIRKALKRHIGRGIVENLGIRTMSRQSGSGRGNDQLHLRITIPKGRAVATRIRVPRSRGNEPTLYNPDPGKPGDGCPLLEGEETGLTPPTTPGDGCPENRATVARVSIESTYATNVTTDSARACASARAADGEPDRMSPPHIVELPPALRTPALSAAWARWTNFLGEVHLRDCKPPPVGATFNQHIRTLARVGSDAERIELIERSIGEGWKNLYALDRPRRSGRPSSAKTNKGGSHGTADPFAGYAGDKPRLSPTPIERLSVRPAPPAGERGADGRGVAAPAR